MYVKNYLVSIFVPWIARTVLYHYGFRWRHIHATIQSKIIVAGAPLVIGGLIPFPTGPILLFLLGIATGLYLCRKFTDGKLYPDLVLVVAGVEIVSLLVIDRLMLPGLR